MSTSTATASYDSRDGRAVATTGGYWASLHGYTGMGGAESFGRFDVQALHHFRFHNRLVVSARGRLETTVGDEADVPYLLLPSVGSGARFARSAHGDFVGPHTVLGTLEARCVVRGGHPSPARRGRPGAGSFYDVGEAALHPGELFDAPGAGCGHRCARVHWRNTTPARVEIGEGERGLARGVRGTRAVSAR